jgi:hypothetical protein
LPAPFPSLTLTPSVLAFPVTVAFSVTVVPSAVHWILPLAELTVRLAQFAASAWAVGVATLIAKPPMLASTVEANTLVAMSDERRRAATRVLRDMYFPSSQYGARAPIPGFQTGPSSLVRGMHGRVSGISDLQTMQSAHYSGIRNTAK